MTQVVVMTELEYVDSDWKLNSPVDKGALGVHEVDLAVEPRPRLHHGRRVGEGADGARDLGQVAARHHRRRLVVDAHLEAGWTPKSCILLWLCCRGRISRLHKY